MKYEPHRSSKRLVALDTLEAATWSETPSPARTPELCADHDCRDHGLDEQHGPWMWMMTVLAVVIVAAFAASRLWP